MIVHYLATEEEYTNLLKDGVIVFESSENTECSKWACDYYKQKLNLKKDVFWLELGEYTSDVEAIKKYCLADCLSYLITIDIPENQYVLMKADSIYYFFNNNFVTLNEQEYDSEEFQIQNDPNFKLREHNWVRLFDENLCLGEDWCDNNFVPYFHKICKEWIKDTQIFRGTNWKKWIGPDKVDPETYPPFEGFGDILKINDQFTIAEEAHGPFTLVGWEKDEDLYIVYYMDFADEEKEYCSHSANTFYGDRIYNKVINET